jgi:hypothetical protein
MTTAPNRESHPETRLLRASRFAVAALLVAVGIGVLFPTGQWIE